MRAGSLAGPIMVLFLILDLLVVISLSMIYISDDSMGPANLPEPELPEIHEISNDGTYRIYEMGGHTFMEEIATGKVRLVSITEIHLTLTPNISQ